MKGIFILQLALCVFLQSFSQIIKVTNDNSDDFAFELDSSYLVYNKYNSSGATEEVYVYNVSHTLVDNSESYLCDIDGDYVLFSSFYSDERYLYIYDVNLTDYYLIDTVSQPLGSKASNYYILFPKINTETSYQHMNLYYAGMVTDLGVFNGNILESDLSDYRAVWAEKEVGVFYYDGSITESLLFEEEIPKRCMITDEVVVWVGQNTTNGSVNVYYKTDYSTRLLNPNGYANWDWVDVSGEKVVWLEDYPSGGIYLFDGINTRKIFDNILPVNSTCAIDGSHIVFGGTGVIHHYNIDNNMLTTYELGENRIANNLKISGLLIAWTENSNENREIYMADLNDLNIKSSYYLGLDQINANKLVLYPNPASTILELRGMDLNYKPYIITNISGYTVKQGKLLQNQAINIKSLTPGLYFMNIENTVLKFLKE